MDHKPHIGLVDAHAKGYGGHNHVDLFKQKRILIGTAGGRIHAGMIGQRLDVVDPEHLGQFLDSLAAQTVDDAALAGMALDKLDYVLVNV